jgi:phosphoglycolate phosphatase-like HAD superfamily hydrolase
MDNQDMKPKNLIIFDMDGVIIDVSRSYRDVTRQTSRLFFKPAHAFNKLPDPLFPLVDLARLKQTGGLNNDWDVTCEVIKLLFNLVVVPEKLKNKDAWRIYEESIGQCDVTQLAAFLNSSVSPLTDLVEKYGRQKNDLVDGLYSEDVGSGNIIKQIFQEIYLGEELFAATYGFPAFLFRGEGYINRERLLVEEKIFQDLSRDNTLAIATGRPGAEAEYPLEHYNLRKYFSMVYSLDNCISEEQRMAKQGGVRVSLSKPHPFMLDAIAENTGEDFSSYYYIGDMPDDMIAASRAKENFLGIGFIKSSPDKDRLTQDLKKAGATYIIEDMEALKKIVEKN